MIPTGANSKPGATVTFARWLSVLLFAGIAMVGGLSIWHGLRVREDNRWPTVDGVVVRGWVKTMETRNKDKSGVLIRRETHVVMVDYTFAVNGQALSASSAAPRQIEDDEGESAAQAIADSFVPDSTIVVFYQPGNPKDSRLRHVDVLSNTWLWYVGAGGWAVVSSLAGIAWLMLRRPSAM